MKQALTLMAIASLCVATHAAPLTFTGNSKPVWSEKPSASTGLEEIYMAHELPGVSAVYSAQVPASQVTVTTWDARGAQYAEPADEATITRSGNQVSISSLKSGSGYAFTEGNRTTYYWIVDYSTVAYSPQSLDIASEQECGRTWLDFEGNAAPIIYHGINGRSWTLDRQLRLSYTTLTFDKDNFSYNSANADVNLESIRNKINVDAPLCDTYFTLTGDRFLRFWNEETEITSPRYGATTVATETRAVQQGDKPDNQVTVDTDGLGGSAPVIVDFEAIVNDATAFHEWQFSHDEDFYDIIMRTQQLSFTQTFTEMGTTYARFVAANADASCETQSETYKVYIGESFLRCPNAFSPGATEGVNDEWKVSYKSLISFECYIFNSWGQKMAEFRDPAKGWDGKHNGKLVPAGVYYYVIKATGSDNKKYNLSGDINIIGYTGE